ncbi:MAG: class I SAM-dependent methyltransferase [Candidatus Daviesbacteria bacterium]|nr:class I SAM-dependent methyltransferase [Candidatus Daviesbacteria bacterium]
MINRTICQKIEQYLPHAHPDLTELYNQIVAKQINTSKNLIVLDVGAGRTIPYISLLSPQANPTLIALDFNEKELAFNKHFDKKIVADLNEKLPLTNKSVDLIISRYTLEHLKNMDNFLKESNRVLKTKGKSIHLFSCKYAPFSLLNQLLPHKISHLLLSHFIPGGTDIHGFKTHYNYCNYSSVKKLFKKNGFEVKNLYLSYYQSRYYNFFVPFYLLSILYESILNLLNLKNLGAYILIESQKI